MAPKAYLGNYKVFGSPEINDFSTDDVLIAALTDAISDGMDIVSMSIGGPAFTGPLDSGSACGLSPGVPCDLGASAFEAAASMKGAPVIIVAAGNQGANGVGYPTFNSVSSPGTAPSVVAVGGTSNSHGFLPAVRIAGLGVPANLTAIAAQPTDTSNPNFGAYAAPLVDVGKISADNYACGALPAGSLTGAYALIQRGPSDAPCSFISKFSNAITAGGRGRDLL